MSQELIQKEYGFNDESENVENSMMQIEQSRAVAEVQSAYVIAKRFPRDENKSFQKIMKSCERPFLAEQAMYAYHRGVSIVNGPSIRLAEVLLQCWGNCDAGIREISQSNGFSVAEAYAIDLETNTRITKVFHVPHERHTKKGKQKLTDPRDIYELVANQGSRRLRACILGVIPGDVVDAAVDKCKYTLSHGKEPISDRIRKMVTAFDEMGIKIIHIEKRLGHKLDAIIESELITLRSIHKSLKDGMANREDFFDIGIESQVNESIKSLIDSKKKPEPAVVNYTTGEVNITNQPEAKKVEEHEKVKKSLLNAKSLDTLDLAADLIRECDKEHQEELSAIYNKRKSEIK